MAKKEIAVKVQDLTKTFHIPLEASTGIKQKLINTLKGRKGYREFTPLNDISFEIEKGDFFGIVGRNGSGKSTLLKTIAGIYSPNRGTVTVNGTLVPFIELGVGFNPELSGRENVFLNGALLGFSRDEMEAMYDDIVDFAELHDFMDERLKNYSSGMQVRLAFSIAIRAEGDILLLDEVLAVGDEAFQRKCFAYFENLKRNKKTVILVTHDMAAVEKFCNKAILIDKGEIIERGRSDIVAHAYKRIFSVSNEDMMNDEEEHESSKEQQRLKWGTGEASIASVRTLVSPERIASRLGIVWHSILPDSKKVYLAYTVKTADRRSLFGERALIEIPKNTQKNEEAVYEISFDNCLSCGDYYYDFSLRFADKDEYIEFWIDAAGFTVNTSEQNGLNILVNTTVKKV